MGPAERSTLIGNLAPEDFSQEVDIFSWFGSALIANLPFHHELQVLIYAPEKFLAGCHMEGTLYFAPGFHILSDAFASPAAHVPADGFHRPR